MRSAHSARAGLLTTSAFAQTAYPAPREGTWVAKDFKFTTGETLAEVKLQYTTIGDPAAESVLLLHGTLGSAASFLNANFAGELFGPGQSLDATRYFLILPDALGNGRSAKPSDGLRTKFPRYNYDDMVAAQYRLVTEGLGIKHLRLVISNSQGGMHTWNWGVNYPRFMDALVPMASQPTEMAGRNWMMRRMLTESVRRDPAWNNGDYTTPPTLYKFANVMFGIGTSGGTQSLFRQADTRAKADKLVEDRLAALTTNDANDFLYGWDASRDFNPGAQLERIEAQLLAINSADDERNPVETEFMDAAMKRVKNGRLFLIAGSPETAGHGTTGMAKFWKGELAALLQAAPRKPAAAQGGDGAGQGPPRTAGSPALLSGFGLVVGVVVRGVRVLGLIVVVRRGDGVAAAHFAHRLVGRELQVVARIAVDHRVGRRRLDDLGRGRRHVQSVHGWLLLDLWLRDSTDGARDRCRPRGKLPQTRRQRGGPLGRPNLDAARYRGCGPGARVMAVT